MTRARKAQENQSLTGPEERQLRNLVGQLLWTSRCSTPELSFAISELSGKLATPMVADLMKANVWVRRLRSMKGKQLISRSDVGFRSAIVVVWSDASFGATDNENSQHGHLITWSDPMVEKAEPGELVAGSSIDCHLRRIRRACRSTLATDAFGISEGEASGMWLRSLLNELFHRRCLFDASRRCAAGAWY